MGSDESHFNVSVGSDGQNHKTVSTPLALPLGQTGSCYSHSSELHLMHVRSFNVALRLQKPQDVLGTGSPGRPPRLSHSCWALTVCVHVQFYFTSTETVRTIRDGEPRTATSTFTQLLSSPLFTQHTLTFKRNIQLLPCESILNRVTNRDKGNHSITPMQ